MHRGTKRINRERCAFFVGTSYVIYRIVLTQWSCSKSKTSIPTIQIYSIFYVITVATRPIAVSQVCVLQKDNV